jgi:hypothetical protein
MDGRVVREGGRSGAITYVCWGIERTACADAVCNVLPVHALRRRVGSRFCLIRSYMGTGCSRIGTPAERWPREGVRAGARVEEHRRRLRATEVAATAKRSPPARTAGLPQARTATSRAEPSAESPLLCGAGAGEGEGPYAPRIGPPYAPALAQAIVTRGRKPAGRYRGRRRDRARLRATEVAATAKRSPPARTAGLPQARTPTIRAEPSAESPLPCGAGAGEGPPAAAQPPAVTRHSPRKRS